jgi:hypothetical protein
VVILIQKKSPHLKFSDVIARSVCYYMEFECQVQPNVVFTFKAVFECFEVIRHVFAGCYGGRSVAHPDPKALH